MFWKFALFHLIKSFILCPFEIKPHRLHVPLTMLNVWNLQQYDVDATLDITWQDITNTCKLFMSIIVSQWQNPIKKTKFLRWMRLQSFADVYEIQSEFFVLLFLSHASVSDNLPGYIFIALCSLLWSLKTRHFLWKNIELLPTIFQLIRHLNQE